MYLSDRAFADKKLCQESPAGLSLGEAVSHYGCPYCGGKIHEVVKTSFGALSAIGYTYVRCRVCQLVYPWPRLNREALYRRVNDSWMNTYLKSVFPEVTYWPHCYIHPQKEFLRLKGKKVLEVGPGAGQLLDYLKKIGVHAIGVEPNEIAAKHCLSHGLEVIQTNFDSKLLARNDIEGPFDAIIFMESIYHLFDLKETFQVASQLLRSGGLVIIRAFNTDSFLMQCAMLSSSGIDGLSIPINGSPSVYGNLLTHSGFRVRKVYSHSGNILAYLGLNRTLLQSYGIIVFWGFRAFGRLFDFLLRIFGHSRNFVIVAEKNSSDRSKAFSASPLSDN